MLMLLKIMAQDGTTMTIEDTIPSIIELVNNLMHIKMKQGITMKMTHQVKLV
jgi:hypothetical protein